MRTAELQFMATAVAATLAKTLFLRTLTLRLRGDLDGLRALSRSPLVVCHHSEGVGLLRLQVAHGKLKRPRLRCVDCPFPKIK